jgi:hypothetical protein
MWETGRNRRRKRYENFNITRFTDIKVPIDVNDQIKSGLNEK